MSKQNVFILFSYSQYIILYVNLLKEYVKNVTFFAETFSKKSKMDIYFCPFLKILKKFCEKTIICD